MNIYRSIYKPKPTEEIKKQKAFIIGGGIAGLSAAVFLIDDAGMPEKISPSMKKETISEDVVMLS